MPKFVEDRVRKLLSSKDFYPDLSEKERKSHAWAIAYDQYNKKNASDNEEFSKFASLADLMDFNGTFKDADIIDERIIGAQLIRQPVPDPKVWINNRPSMQGWKPNTSTGLWTRPVERIQQKPTSPKKNIRKIKPRKNAPVSKTSWPDNYSQIIHGIQKATNIINRAFKNKFTAGYSEAASEAYKYIFSKNTAINAIPNAFQEKNWAYRKATKFDLKYINQPEAAEAKKILDNIIASIAGIQSDAPPKNSPVTNEAPATPIGNINERIDAIKMAINQSGNSKIGIIIENNCFGTKNESSEFTNSDDIIDWVNTHYDKIVNNIDCVESFLNIKNNKPVRYPAIQHSRARGGARGLEDTATLPGTPSAPNKENKDDFGTVGSEDLVPNDLNPRIKLSRPVTAEVRQLAQYIWRIIWYNPDSGPSDPDKESTEVSFFNCLKQRLGDLPEEIKFKTGRDRFKGMWGDSRAQIQMLKSAMKKNYQPIQLQGFVYGTQSAVLLSTSSYINEITSAATASMNTDPYGDTNIHVNVMTVTKAVKECMMGWAIKRKL